MDGPPRAFSLMAFNKVTDEPVAPKLVPTASVSGPFIVAVPVAATRPRVNKINLRACESFAETAARAGTRATDVNAASPCGA
jgi:hypothetical protein